MSGADLFLRAFHHPPWQPFVEHIAVVSFLLAHAEKTKKWGTRRQLHGLAQQSWKMPCLQFKRASTDKSWLRDQWKWLTSMMVCSH